MPLIDEEPAKKKKPAHELGEDLSTLSLNELEERIRLLKIEIERIETIVRSKRASADVAASFFSADGCRRSKMRRSRTISGAEPRRLRRPVNHSLSFTGLNLTVQSSGFEWLLSTLFDASLFNSAEPLPRAALFLPCHRRTPVERVDWRGICAFQRRPVPSWDRVGNDRGGSHG